MNVDTGSFGALTAEVAALREAVDTMTRREAAIDVVWKAGFEAGREARGTPAPPTAARSRSARPRRQRPGYLCLVEGGGGQ